MKKNIIIAYKKDGRLNFGSISFTKDHSEILKLTPENRDVVMEYKDDTLILYPYKEGIVDEKKIKGESLIYLTSYVKINYDKSKNGFKFQFPPEIIRKWNLEENKCVDLIVEENKIIFKPYEEENTMADQDVLNIYSPEYIRNTLPIITVKVEKGGIGKTFFACSIATGLAVTGKKVLVITTDPQNNVLDMLLPVEEKETEDQVIYYSFDDKEIQIDSKTKGLKYWLKNGTGEIINLRENVDFIPLESSLENNKKFEDNIGKILYSLKDKYDCIVIDSVPTKRVDQVVLNYTKRLVIPCAGDRVTVKGVTRIIKDLGADKVSAIVFNKYLNSVIEKDYYEAVKKSLEGSTIFFPEPIKELSAIKQIVFKNKSIWESLDQRLVEVQNVFKAIINKLIIECNLDKVD
ncbi:AAA family ATPase [uncultured Fusobacterium sp.]|uniref:ParA family protein n=1 Tax=uncultured Fusobacterium sp. TaxID=159267 RepID=UPI0025EC67BE|nr:AAA family ATPase [uncultured Fusobacterium sp.]